ncbi:MAG: DUF2927 domain-containing protein [bacterium]
MTGSLMKKAFRVMRHVSVLSVLLLIACAPVPQVAVSKSAMTADRLSDASGPVLAFAPARGLPSHRPNDQIAEDFIDLEFHMESGLALPVLTRFEGPITVSLTGAVPPSAPAELAKLITRLQAEAGIDLHQVGAASAAAVTIQFVPKAALQRLEPSAACFVAPNVSSLAEYRANRGSATLDWQQMTRRTRVAIFMPSDTSPQEVRDCLHEETAQALGPLNDLYRLPDSVFNDDNFQSVLTGFDMLMLRLHYATELTTGMSEAEVAARLPALVARLNPSGQYPGGWSAADTPRVWIDAVDTALGPRSNDGARIAAAQRMLAIAEAQGWRDNRLGFAWFALGRLQAKHDPVAAERSYSAAARIYERLPDDGVHLSHALMQLSAIALASGRAEQAITYCDRALPLAQRGQNAALLASLMMIKSESLRLLGRDAEAMALRLDSLPAARYGFGDEQAVRARAAEIASLALRGRNG